MVRCGSVASTRLSIIGASDSTVFFVRCWPDASPHLSGAAPVSLRSGSNLSGFSVGQIEFSKGVASQGRLIRSRSRSNFLSSDSPLTDGMNVWLCLPSSAVLFSSGASLARRLSVRPLMVQAGLVASFSLSSFMNDPPPSLFTPVVRPQWSVRGPCLAAVTMATPLSPPPPPLAVLISPQQLV